MAELVDALVSKTSEVTLVPVRPRLRVQREAQGLPFLICKEMYTVYVIKSTTRDWFYVGQSNNLPRRLDHHDKGYNRSTKSYRPFELVLTEEFPTRELARKREKELKSTMGKRYIRDLYRKTQQG